MLLPGFRVTELPVKISNVNNLRFDLNGKLTALGYDGRVHILRDTDGDGLEDSAALFWDQPTLSVPVGMAWSKEGLYVSSHGKVSLLRDTDGNGKGDLEEIVARGWPATDVASGGVDATAVTLDEAGNVFFGLLTADYSNPYRVKDGVSRYDLRSPRGTIQRWDPSTKQLETIATGIRVPYTLAFNRHGDLFLTDQEGETWCPGGNPLDELNHIRPGRNYGFPPSHEKYLPNLVSELPVVGFGPQHQSACGFVFNDPSRRQKLFGPAWWEGDAFVAGESRGKIWRAKLVKTAAGYVGKETLIARLNMLPTDLAISPSGDLYVSCHSGNPDWGTGPNGEGKLFRIKYEDPHAPQPVAAWCSGPMEVRIAFDRPLDAAVTNHAGGMKIEFGEFVRAADRLELLKPPYKVVTRQDASPRGKLAVVGTKLSPDQRTLTLTTDPHPQSVYYAVTLPRVGARGVSGPAAVVDVDYSLGGVEGKWVSDDSISGGRWEGWLAHLNWQVNREFLGQSAEHEKLFGLIKQPGRLRMRTQLRLPTGRHILRLTARAPFQASLGATSATARQEAGSYSAELVITAGEAPVPLAIDLATSSVAPFDFEVSYSQETDPTVRAVPFTFLLVPWAPAPTEHRALPEERTELAGGDYERGRSHFFGDRLKCATCHRVRGEGGSAGPDLSNLVHRDASSVLRDIKDPNAAINPDYVGYSVTLQDGTDLTGFVRAQDEQALRIVGVDGTEQAVARTAVKEMRPSQVSLMPSGLLEGLKEAEVRDLLTFLLHQAPTRSAAEVQGFLRGERKLGSEKKEAVSSLHIVLVASKQDHGPGQHDYPAWQTNWIRLLGQQAGVRVTPAWEWPGTEQFKSANVMVFYYWNHNWSHERLAELDAYQARGGGVAVFHSATIADQDPEGLALRIGLAAQPSRVKYLHMPFVLHFVAPSHPITRGFQKLDLLDEPYWPMIGDTNRIVVLATAEVEEQGRPLIWTFEKGKSRVFASIPGHYSWTFDDPLFRLLALRGIAWAAGELPSRFDGLAK